MSRFWYENPGIFNEKQLEAIQGQDKVLEKLFCNNGEELRSVKTVALRKYLIELLKGLVLVHMYDEYKVCTLDFFQ